jgi:hypothetical protein
MSYYTNRKDMLSTPPQSFYYVGLRIGTNPQLIPVSENFVRFKLKNIRVLLRNDRLYAFKTKDEARQFRNQLYDLGSASNWTYKIMFRPK